MGGLEAGLRVPFQHRSRRVSLTSAGLSFQEHARAILIRSRSRSKSVGSQPNSKNAATRNHSHLGAALLPKLLGVFSSTGGVDLSVWGDPAGLGPLNAVALMPKVTHHEAPG